MDLLALIAARIRLVTALINLSIALRDSTPADKKKKVSMICCPERKCIHTGSVSLFEFT